MKNKLPDLSRLSKPELFWLSVEALSLALDVPVSKILESWEAVAARHPQGALQ